MILHFQKLCKFSPRLKEVRIHFCQKSESSKGIREFVEKCYPIIKEQNPKLPILIRQCEGTQPLMWARFEKGNETSMTLTNSSANDVKEHLVNHLKSAK